MIRLNYGNSLEGMSRMAKGSSNLIILDPPWGILSRNNKHPDVQWDHRPSLLKLGEFACQLLSQCGYIVVFGDRKLINAIGIEWADILDLRDEIIWSKPSNIPTSILKPLPTHEYCNIYMPKGVKVSSCTWNPRVVPGKPYLKKGTPGSISTRRQKKSARHENTSGMRHLRSVIQAPNKPAMKAWERKGMQHPTMKPIQLLTQIIRAYSNPGDMVIDPFSGSGSSAMTCFLVGRNCVAMENDSMWYHQSVMRFNRLKAMLGRGQVEQLLRQPELGIDEFDSTALFA